MCLGIALSLPSAFKATQLRYQLFEGYKPFGQRRMERSLRFWAYMWLTSTIAGMAGAFVALYLTWIFFEWQTGAAYATFLTVAGAGLVVVWAVVMVDAYRKYRKAGRWDFLGTRY